MSSKKKSGDDETTDDEKPKPKKDKLQRQIDKEEKSRQKREARLGKGNKNFAAISTGENKSIGRQNLAVSYEDRPANDPKCVDGKKVEKEKQKERDIEDSKKQAGNDNMQSGRKNDDS